MSNLSRYIKAQAPSVPTGWQRPEYWPDRPTDFESNEGIYYLVEIFSGTTQYLFWNCGSNTDIYFDDVLYTSTTGGVPIYITIDDTFGFDYNGRKFTWIYFDIDGVNPYINLANNDFATNPNGARVTNILEVLVNKDLNYFYGTDSGYSYGIKMYTRNMWFKENISILNTQGLFINTNLENIQNLPIFRGLCGEAWRECNLNAFPKEFDFTNVTNLAYSFFSNGKVTPKEIIFTNTGGVTSLNNTFASNFTIMSVNFDDCSAVINAAFSFSNCKNLQRLILTDLAVSFDITNTYNLGKQAILDMIDSLADLSSTTTQNITMVNNPFNADVDVVNAATDKNWTILT